MLRAGGPLGCDRDVFLHRFFKNLDTRLSIRMGPKCTSVKTSNFRTFRFPNFSWQRKIPTLKFKKFQWDLVSFCEIGSVSVRLVQFLWDWFSFCEIGSVLWDWVTFSKIGSVSARMRRLDFSRWWVKRSSKSLLDFFLCYTFNLWHLEGHLAATKIACDFIEKAFFRFLFFRFL